MAGDRAGLKAKAYDTIKKRLITCEYPPDTLLNEVQLSNSLGISRTPFREAVIQLEQEGFLRIMPKKGIYVTAITANDILQIFQTRREIEPVTLLMARPNFQDEILLDFKRMFEGEEGSVIDSYHLDTAMHLYFIENCGNRYIIDMMHKVFDANTRIIVASKQNQLHIQESRLEHIEILDSLLAGQNEKAAEQLSEHIIHCRKAALDNFYDSQPGAQNYELTYMQYLDDRPLRAE